MEGGGGKSGRCAKTRSRTSKATRQWEVGLFIYPPLPSGEAGPGARRQKKAARRFPRLKVRLSASPLAALGLGIGHRLEIWLPDWRPAHSPTR